MSQPPTISAHRVGDREDEDEPERTPALRPVCVCRDGVAHCGGLIAGALLKSLYRWSMKCAGAVISALATRPDGSTVKPEPRGNRVEPVRGELHVTVRQAAHDARVLRVVPHEDLASVQAGERALLPATGLVVPPLLADDHRAEAAVRPQAEPVGRLDGSRVNTTGPPDVSRSLNRYEWSAAMVAFARSNADSPDAGSEPGSWNETGALELALTVTRLGRPWRTAAWTREHPVPQDSVGTSWPSTELEPHRSPQACRRGRPRLQPARPAEPRARPADPADAGPAQACPSAARSAGRTCQTPTNGSRCSTPRIRRCPSRTP